MINSFDVWAQASNVLENSRLDELTGTVIAIEAAHYLSNRIFNDPQWREPLLPALGGVPFAMKRLVEGDLRKFKEHNITPIFVFGGLDVGKKDNTVFEASKKASSTCEAAWELYNQHQAQNAVDTFGNSSAIRPGDLFRYLQSILRQAGVRFQVAPYSAWAQLAYLEKYAKDLVQSVAGSSEILLFDVDKVITSWNFEQGDFTWLRRRACVQELGINHPEMFVDACILSGTSMHPPLPPLKPKPHKLRSAAEMMVNVGRGNGINVCLHYQDDPHVRESNYIDKYRKNRLAIKHHVILTKDGKVEPLDVENAPGDIHEFIGQRLPDEIYYYLSKGLISPRVLNWRTSGEIIELPPIDGGDSDYYRSLVRDQLTPLRTSAISLLSYSLTRFYQHKDVSLRCWFDQRNPKIISMRDLTDPRPIVAKWNVKAEFINEQVSRIAGHGILGVAVRSLANSDFPGKSITAKDGKKPLTTADEVLYNAIWRFLQLRQYVDSDHQLTDWGKVLSATISALGGRSELEEAAIIAVELARLDLLTAENMFPSYGGAPQRGSEDDRKFNLLVSRVACLGKFRHNEIGFTGPLSRHLLAYHSMISAVRNSLRDLAEVSLTTLLLNGDAERDRKDFTDLGMDLPFLIDNDCALGIAVKSYLDELTIYPNPADPANRAAVKEVATTKWFPQAVDLPGDLATAWALWDAVYAGVKQAGDLIKERKLFDDANKWLAGRR